MLLHDIRLAIRSLRRSPGFLVIGILSLGLALGLNTSMFGLLDAVVHPRMPFAEPERLRDLLVSGTGIARRETRMGAYNLLRNGARSFDEVGGLSARNAMVQTSVGAEAQWVVLTSANFFRVLGVKPHIGRPYVPGSPTAESEAVVSFRFWKQMLRGRESLDGVTVRIDDRAYSVVGVMPPGMDYPFQSDVWIPMSPVADATGAGLPFIWPIVRVRSGITPQAMATELALLSSRLTAQYGNAEQPISLSLRPPLGLDGLRLKEYHAAMAAAAAGVLLIACANLASLMLARGITKRRELALRLALGATRGALVRQMLVESGIVALAGGALGMLLSVWGIDLVTHAMTAQLALLDMRPPYLSWRVYAFGVLVTGATVFLFGLVPALRASRVDASEPLKESAATTTGPNRRGHTALVIAQVALSLVLLMNAGLLLRTLQRIGTFDFGYDARQLIAAGIGIPRSRHVAAREVDAFYDALQDRARALPGIRATTTLGWGAPDGSRVLSEGADGGRRYAFVKSYARVSPSFVRTLGMRIVEGRDFEEGDRATTGVVIVDQRAAKQLWPYGGAVGRMIKLGDERSTAAWLPVVGVARNISLGFRQDPDLEEEPMIYVVGGSAGPTSRRLIVRTGQVTGDLMAALQREIDVASAAGVRASVTPMLQGYDKFLAGRGFVAGLFVLFGAFALALAAVGLYGVLAYSVAQRTREFGVRIALGASPKDLLTLVFRDAMTMTLAGTAAGTIMSFWTAKLLDAFLYGVAPTDVTALVGAEALLMAVSLLACTAPALRAARATPVEILRAV